MPMMPISSSDRQLVDSYGAGTFRVSGRRFEGSVLVFPDRTEAWPVTAFGEVTIDSLRAVIDAEPPVEVLLVGCGVRPMPLPGPLRQAMRDAGIGIDAMATDAACRTYNMLSAEARRVAAALIALP